MDTILWWQKISFRLCTFVVCDNFATFEEIITMNHLNQQWQIFWHSLMFFTRIPVPKHIVYSAEKMQFSTAYLPLTGLVVGCFGALVFWLSDTYIDTTIAAVLSTVATVWLTGAFHEDGFADLCDGFGGGYTKEKVLEIMKDSRSGAYGVVGTVLILLLKVSALVKIGSLSLIAIPVAHTLSRITPVIISYFWLYVRPDDGTSKSKDTARKLPIGYMWLAFVSSIIPLFFMPAFWYFVLIPVVLVVSWVLGSWFKRRIGGYAGDCLGASQQLSEVVIYLTIIICTNQLAITPDTFINQLQHLFR